MHAVVIEESRPSRSGYAPPAFFFMKTVAWCAMPLGVLYLGYCASTIFDEWCPLQYMTSLEAWAWLGILSALALDFLAFISIFPVAIWSLINIDSDNAAIVSCSDSHLSGAEQHAPSGFPCIVLCWIAGGVSGLLLMESGLASESYGTALLGLLLLAIGVFGGVACEEFRTLLWRQIRHAEAIRGGKGQTGLARRRFWPLASHWAMYVMLILFISIPSLLIALGSLLHDETSRRTWDLLLYGHWAIFTIAVVLHLGLLDRAAHAWRTNTAQRRRPTRASGTATERLSDNPWLVIIALLMGFLVWGMLDAAGLSSLTILFLTTLFVFVASWWRRRRKALATVTFWSASPVLFPAWWTVLYLTGFTVNGHINPLTSIAVVWVESLVLWRIAVWARLQRQCLSRRVGNVINAPLSRRQWVCVYTLLLAAFLVFALNVSVLFVEAHNSDLSLLREPGHHGNFWITSYAATHPISPSCPSHYEMLDQKNCILDLIMGRMPLLVQSLFHMAFVVLMMREFFLMAQVSALARRRLGAIPQTGDDVPVRYEPAPESRTAEPTVTAGIPMVEA